MKNFKNYILENKSADMFCRGYCPEFAIALHRITNWPIFVINQIQKDENEEYEEYGSLVHVVVRTPNGKYADARGIRTEEEIAKHLVTDELQPLINYQLIPYTEEDLEAEQSIESEAIELANTFILKNKHLFNST